MVIRVFVSSIIEKVREDGSMVISVEITDDREIISIVQYWMPEIRVLSPKKIDEMITGRIKTYLERDSL